MIPEREISYSTFRDNYEEIKKEEEHKPKRKDRYPSIRDRIETSN